MTYTQNSDNEIEIACFSSNRAIYIYEHIILAILGAMLMVGFLVYQGNPDWWVGIVGAIIGISIRGFYVASEQLDFVWVLTNQNLVSPSERVIALSEIENARGMISAVQIITHDGEKFLMKYQPNKKDVIRQILHARDIYVGGTS